MEISLHTGSSTGARSFSYFYNNSITNNEAEHTDTLGRKDGYADGEVAGTSSGMCSRDGWSQSHGKVGSSPGNVTGRGRGCGFEADGHGHSDGTGSASYTTAM